MTDTAPRAPRSVSNPSLVWQSSSSRAKAKPASKDSSYVPWKDRNAAYWVKLFDDFAKVVVAEHKIELLLLVIASLYALNYVIGSRTNEGVVLDWANEFGLPLESTGKGPPTIYGKNFALVGVDTKTSASEIIFRESQSCFKCYCSGRRHVKWMMTTLELRKRQDLMSEIVNLVLPSKDRMIVDVSMSDGAMEPLVFAVVKKKNAKAFISDHKDMKRFAKVIQDPIQDPKHHSWPKKKLVCLSESKDLCTSLMSDVVVKNVFDSKVYLKRHERHFESMYFTTEGAGEDARSCLRFEFSLPKSSKKMALVEDLVGMVFHMIDQVGTLKLSPEALKRAKQKRKDVEEEAFKETLAQRQEAAIRKREEKYQAEKANMTAAQAAKADEKRKNKLIKKQSRPKMKMMK